MSTSARIGIELQSGKVKAIYCNFDGYPNHTGEILLKNYANHLKLEKLIDLGTIKFLDALIDPDPKLPHSIQNPQPGVTEVYGRDGEAEDHEPAEFLSSIEEFMVEQSYHTYSYIYTKEGKWLARCMNHPFSKGRKYNTIETYLAFTS